MAIEIAPSSPANVKDLTIENDKFLPPEVQSPWYGKVIDFTFYISPFVYLKTLSEGALVSTSNLIYKNVVVINEFTARWIYAGYTVFLRLIFSPEFDPATNDFSKRIDYLEGRLPKLQSQFLKVSTTRFCSDYMIFRDLEALEEVGNEIRQTYKLLERYAKSTGRPVPPYPIHARVTELKAQYKALENQRMAFIDVKQDVLLEKFQGMTDMFIQAGVPLPPDIHRDLSKTLRKMKDVLFDELIAKESYQQKLKHAENKLRDLYTLTISKDVKKSKSIEGVQPLKLVNIGNSCYMDSAIQALLCVDKVCDVLRQPIDPKGRSEEEMKSIKAIQEELLKFIESKTIDFDGKLTLMELMLLINRGRGGPSLHRLRSAFFNSGLHGELNELGIQHDAASILELMAAEFLPCEFKAQKHCITDVFPGLDFVKDSDARRTLQIPFTYDGDKKLTWLKNLITKELGKKLEKEENPNPLYHLAFDPKDAVVVDEEKAALSLKSEPQKLSEYTTFDRLLDLQDIMVLQIKRFVSNDYGVVKKDSSPLVLPADGIIDFTPFYDAPEGQPSKALYKIKSYVSHLGGYGGGHYVSYVEKGGKYFYCNDLPSITEEITREEFLSRKDAYMIVLERLTPEEVAKKEAETAQKEAKEKAKLAADEKRRLLREEIREKKRIAERAKAGG